MSLTSFVYVAIGGAVGSLLRHGCNVAVGALSAPLPLATFGVNVVGCFLIGYISTRIDKNAAIIPFLTTGFLGGFTTFSTYGLEVSSYVREGQSLLGIFYALTSIIAAIIAVFAGIRYATIP